MLTETNYDMILFSAPAAKQQQHHGPDSGAVHDGVDVVDELKSVAGGSLTEHVPLVDTINVTSCNNQLKLFQMDSFINCIPCILTPFNKSQCFVNFYDN